MTHLISKLDTSGNVKTSTTINGTRPSLSDHPAASFPSVTTENMHPTIAQDMRTFDLSEHHFYDFPAHNFSGAEPNQSSSMNDIQFTESIFTAPQPVGSYNFQAGYHSPSMGFTTAPPMLDPTWQNFVEQLGF